MTRDEINERFEEEYKKLVDEGENFQYLITGYGTGGDDFRVWQLDDSFKRIKLHLKNIRTLALRLKIVEDAEKHDDDRDDDTPAE